MENNDMDPASQLARLGVQAKSARDLEVTLEARATSIFEHADEVQRNSRRRRLEAMIADSQERLGKARSDRVIDRLMGELEAARNELAAINAAPIEEVAVVKNYKSQATEDVIDVVGDKEAQENYDDVLDMPRAPIKRKVVGEREPVSEDDSIIASSESESDGDEVVAPINDDGNNEVFTARLAEWCRQFEISHEIFRESLIRQTHTIPTAMSKVGMCEVSRFSMPKMIFDDLLLDYQRDGVSWLLSHVSREEGGILADEMGLGKTAQAIAMLIGMHCSGRLSRPALVVCPTTVMRQWVGEVRKWWPPFRIVLLHASGSAFRDGFNGSRIAKCLAMSEVPIFLTSYGTLAAYAADFHAQQWSAVILDEGHKIRNPQTDVAVQCNGLRAPSRFILSGTPIQNNLVELWALMNFVERGQLGTLAAFKTEFVAPIAAGGYASASHFTVQLAFKCACLLKESIEPFLLRRVKADVAQQLPPKEEQILFCKLTNEQRALYQECLESDDIKAIIEGDRNVLAGIDMLRKVCNHPLLVHKKIRLASTMTVDQHLRMSCKLAVLKCLLEMWRGRHRSLIFCQTRQMLDIVETFLQMLPDAYTYLRMDGNTGLGQRARLIDRFNDDLRIDTFLLTTKVGGLGVNLTGADRVIIFDPDWNPSTDLQARERVWRLGQLKPVAIYRLITMGTIEEKIYHRQIFKQFLTNRILHDPKQARFFKAADLYDLFTLGEGTSETADMFSGLEQEIMLKMGAADVKVGNDKRVVSEEVVPDKTHILDTLFHAVDGLHSALRHDLIVERPPLEARLVQQEVGKLATGALSALKQSMGAPHAPPLNADDTARKRAAMSERLFKTFRGNGGVLTSDQLVQIFGSQMRDPDDAVLFRSLLRGMAKLTDKRWQLKPEFRDL